MAHNDYVLRPGGVYSEETVLTPGRVALLDQRTAESINAISGGTWAPASPINIGGSGLELSTATATLSGEVKTGKGAVGLVCMANEYPFFEVPRTRTVVIPLAIPPAFQTSSPYTGVDRSLTPWGLRNLSATQAEILVPLPSLRLHHGATIVTARLRHRLGSQIATAQILNGGVPFFRILRFHYDGLNTYVPNTLELYNVPTFAAATPYAVGDLIRPTVLNGKSYRCTVAGTSAASSAGWSTTVGNSQVSNTATFRVEPGWSFNYQQFALAPIGALAEPSATFNNGLPYDITMPINQNAVVDTEAYAYALQIVDPGGNAGSPYRNIYHSLSIELANIVTMSPP